MSAGEVERLVSELSGGTGGDEEEEWLYGGTELPVPSLPGSLRLPLPTHKRSASLDPLAAVYGLSCGTSSGLSLAELNVRLSPPPQPPLALPVPPNTHAAAAGVRPESWEPDQAPSLALLPVRDFSVASSPRPLLLFFIWILSSVDLSFLVPRL